MHEVTDRIDHLDDYSKSDIVSEQSTGLTSILLHSIPFHSIAMFMFMFIFIFIIIVIITNHLLQNYISHTFTDCFLCKRFRLAVAFCI